MIIKYKNGIGKECFILKTMLNARKFTELFNNTYDCDVSYKQILYWVNNDLFNNVEKRGVKYLFNEESFNEAIILKKMIVDERYSIAECKEILSSNSKESEPILNTKDDLYIKENFNPTVKATDLNQLLIMHREMINKQSILEAKLEILMNHLGVK